MATAIIFLAEGAEEMETVITADVLRRAEIAVTIAGVEGGKPVKCSRNVIITPDAALSDVASEKFDLVVVPGGNPTSQKKLAESSLVGEILRAQDENNRIIGAICAGPSNFAAHGVAKERVVTSHPTFQAVLEDAGYKYSQERVSIDGHVITSRGPGTATEFAFACASAVIGKDFIKEHGSAMLINF
ncbi:glutathione-independent glyoxalase DJR-1.1-like isoform X2 [Watersipora subatra]